MHFCIYISFGRMLTKAITLVLLLLFSSEFVAMASAVHENKGQESTPHKLLVSYESSATFNLVAEETEERDQRDAILLQFEREVLHPHVFPLILTSKVCRVLPVQVRHSEIPLYTIHRTLII